MTTLDELLTAERPIASVYLQAPSGHSDSAHRFDTRWKNARRRLEQDGAASGVLEQIDQVVADIGHDTAPAIAVFADGELDPVAEPLDDALAHDLVAFDRLPRLVPLLHTHQRSVPHVMVMTDRTGADIVAVVDGEVETDTVEGTDHHINRGRFGGWSHRRIQQRAENRWEDNARDVAERVDEIARMANARVVAVAGDVRATQFLMEHLDERTRSIATILDAGDAEGVAEAVVRLVADQVARDTRSVLETFSERFGTGTAVAGPDAVCDALSEGRVATLLVVDDVDDDRRAYFSLDDSPVCSSSADPAGDLLEGRLVDVAIRSAMLTDADVRVVPSTVLDGNIGAILRW